MCASCKRWDDASIMYYHKRSGFYRHRTCSVIETRNVRLLKSFLDSAVEKRKNNKTIAKCFHCGRWDFRSNLDKNIQRVHTGCTRIRDSNRPLMKPFKTTTCAFTGQPFGVDAETKPNADHNHGTLLYRAHIWAAANRLEGASNSIMKHTGWTIEQVAEALVTYYYNYPGIDVGLQPYPVAGFATREEAEAAFNETIN